MKKLNVWVVTAAMVLSTSVGFAQEGLVAMVEAASAMSIQAQYETIQIDTVPEAITAAVTADFEGAIIYQAFKDESDNYKLVIAIGEESKTLYANAAAEWIEPNE